MAKSFASVGEIVEVYMPGFRMNDPPKYTTDGEVLKVTPTGRATIKFKEKFGGIRTHIFDPLGHVYGNRKYSSYRWKKKPL